MLILRGLTPEGLIELIVREAENYSGSGNPAGAPTSRGAATGAAFFQPSRAVHEPNRR